MNTTNSPKALPADWNSTLASVEQALSVAVTRLQERELALTNPAPLAPTPPTLDFSRFEQRLGAFASNSQQADQRLTEIDAVLREGEESLRQWLGRAEAARRKLAAWVGRA
jgi:hypothetical protein